jgi:hypothetical protein
MGNYLATVAVLFVLMIGAIAVDRLYRRFAARNPECGPFRDKDKGCQSCKGCDDEPARRRH